MSYAIAISYRSVVPELPEVETISRGLAGTVVGKTIAKATVILPRSVIAPAGVDFTTALRGQRIVEVHRRAKYAVIELESGRALVTSLRMTGRLVVQTCGEPRYPYTRVELHFRDGMRLSFADVRTLGRMRLIERNEPWDEHLGVEPLTKAFTPSAFMSMLSGRTTPIKAFLLDQRRIAGIGNIYACESLWEARIAPSKPAKSLSKPAATRLHRAIVDVLNRAVEMRGTSVDDYVDAVGLQGGFQNKLSVYGRHGKPCLTCGRSIVRTVLAQRGTWWCRACQKNK
ncbi:MAG: bifunctional DNA-formamidopyrimidine glycosylase/DNA-(apurinic or apyrimidinic site) lyase [Candidatus Eremiobacteraeota bacterium]|nr:bifunctional DNA-formamidopyrimidine glycosylase/DNA-(apurinic or apyrimidinic site) lyase [Candidatus Eremiobacteraeota bacterium]